MVEIFKTNVQQREQANLLVSRIEQHFTGCHASFDLEDCDKVLRISKLDGNVCATSTISLLRDFGYNAEILPDELHYLPSIMELGFQLQ